MKFSHGSGRPEWCSRDIHILSLEVQLSTTSLMIPKG